MNNLKLRLRKFLHLIQNPHFWAITAIYFAITLLHYPQIYSGLSSTLPFGDGRYTLERILLLIPLIYASFIFGIRVGIVALITALAIMLPQAIFFSADVFASLVEVSGVFIVGAIATLFFWINRSSITRSETAERSLSRIIDGSPVATFVINNQHKVIHWNTAIEALTSITKGEVIGTGNHWKAFYGSNTRVLADLILDQVPAEEINECYQGRSRKSSLIDGAYEAEGHFLVPPSREGKWLRITGSPIKDKDGKITGVVESIEDITIRKKAEDALRESESNFRNVFEGALDAIWVSDAMGNVQNVNEAAARLTGYSLEELMQSNLKLFLTGDSLDRFRQIQSNLISRQTLNRPYEQNVIRKDGSEAICMVNTSALIQNGVVKVFQSIARDVTEQKRLYDNLHYYLQEITRAQEEERKRIARELHDSTAQNLIAVLHHLENLLADKGMIPVGQTKGLWGIYERIRDILQEVRRFSRDLRPSILDDLGLMPVLEWLLSRLKTEHGIDTKLEKTGTERRLTPEMELLLFRIVQESLTNVTKHARASRAEVEVEFAEKKIVVKVKDNGVGFTPPDNVGGLLQSGKLGLVGMQERVQLLGGRIQVSSEPGKGTLVKVEAPIQSEFPQA